MLLLQKDDSLKAQMMASIFSAVKYLKIKYFKKMYTVKT